MRHIENLRKKVLSARREWAEAAMDMQADVEVKAQKLDAARKQFRAAVLDAGKRKARHERLHRQLLDAVMNCLNENSFSTVEMQQ